MKAKCKIKSSEPSPNQPPEYHKPEAALKLCNGRTSIYRLNHGPEAALKLHEIAWDGQEHNIRQQRNIREGKRHKRNDAGAYLGHVQL